MGIKTSGAFEVTAFEPEETDEQPGATLGRVRLTKEFTGGLTGSSVVRMLSVLDGAGGPAAYVAVERFTGELDGRKGSFVLQHSAPGSQGERLAVRVVAGTGAGELAGITGTFELTVDDGGHTYVLEYELG
ncbi:MULTISPECIES: DUF3224 domain-containing protein [unclassified Kitasatospora]|uniref:DUF3224 domain-containing protein n=1 Tax=unclassified Kitasatospora TaxID=2633591 RepID=UPI001AE08C28|nr:DUF3224 domain-containing protein [Kitasatospora sp. RG8]MBP0448823.1 DUF3224 domain-containing protein [Kitasatospora sp. RG8]